jgi:hypothetical protein
MKKNQEKTETPKIPEEKKYTGEVLKLMDVSQYETANGKIVYVGDYQKGGEDNGN